MDSHHKLNKRCKTCGCSICDNNKSGFCNIHRPRNGEHNSFYGHHHKPISEETRKKLSESSKRMWQDENYRKKNISATTGKHRSNEFKEHQRKNALNQFKDNHQKEIRSTRMKQTWSEGKLEWHGAHINKSKDEIELFRRLATHFNTFLDRPVVHYIDDSGKKRWFYPDGCIFGNTIIEYNGSFWHGNDRIYADNDIVAHNITALERRRKDEERYNKLNELGYNVIVVWDTAWKNHEDECLKNIIAFFEWENYKEFPVYEFR